MNAVGHGSHGLSACSWIARVFARCKKRIIASKESGSRRPGVRLDRIHAVTVTASIDRGRRNIVALSGECRESATVGHCGTHFATRRLDRR
jgi:hypothetical protein